MNLSMTLLLAFTSFYVNLRTPTSLESMLLAQQKGNVSMSVQFCALAPFALILTLALSMASCYPPFRRQPIRYRALLLVGATPYWCTRVLPNCVGTSRHRREA